MNPRFSFEMLELIIIYIFIFITGAAFGSFFNVCISRIPKKENIVLTASHCPICNSKIRFYHNIPIFSFLILKGRCKNCKTPIHWHYFLVEILTPLLWLLLFIKNNNQFDLFYLKHLIFISFGVIILFIDTFKKIIPDVLSLPLIMIGIMFGFIPTGDVSWLMAIIGSVGSFVLFLLIGEIFNKATGKMGLGGGDIKLIAAVGAFIGPVGALFTIFISSILAIMTMIIVNHDTNKEFPYGPFIILGSWIYIYLGDFLLSSYLSLYHL